jgi:hypothetical protein
MLALAVTMSCGAYSASAQIYVHARLTPRVVVRSEPPSPRHVWVHEDWQENNGRYEDNGGHWAEPPAEGYRYHEGHWDHSRQGHRWHEGGWNKEHNRGGEGNREHEVRR